MNKDVRTGRFVLGRARFSKIAAVEGIKPNKQLSDDFRRFDDEKLPAAERRRRLSKKYGRES